MREVSLKGTGYRYPVGKIICLGRNYLDHIRELGNQVPDRAVIFCKPASSLIADGGVVIIPDYSDDCHHELELAVLIGRQGKKIPVENALHHVAGYGTALDMTLRDVQNELKSKGLPWDIAKGFDTACPLSDFTPAEQVDNPNNLQLKLTVNGQLRQDGTTAQMMRTVEEIIAELSTIYTLEPGDIILTGTPAGVSRVQCGDELYGEIQQVGSLHVTVA